MKHNIVKGNINNLDSIEETNIPCTGLVMWEEVLEGYICSKCSLYTGLKWRTRKKKEKKYL